MSNVVRGNGASRSLDNLSNVQINTALMFDNDSGIWKSDGKVGVGTITPYYHLTVVDASGTNGPSIGLKRADSVVGSGNRIGRITMMGGETGSQDTVVGSIVVDADADWTSTSSPTRMEFRTTASGATTDAEHMRIDPNGDVGIGTSSPTKKLDVNGDAQIGGDLTVDNDIIASSNLVIGGTTSDASAILDIISTIKGFLPPRMTTAQIDAISTPATGLVAFDTDEDLLRIRKTSDWCHIPCGVVTGQFSHGASQKPSVTTPISLLFDTNDLTLKGITHSTTVKPEEFKATLSKFYTFMLAPQWERTTSGALQTIDFFIQKSTDGGTIFNDIPNSNVKVQAGNDDSNVIPLMFTILMDVDDIIRFQMRISSTGDGLGTMFIAAETGPPTIPATPAQILTIFSGD